MSIFIAISIMLHDPVKVYNERRADTLEYNTILSETGQTVLSQWILWHEYDDGRRHVRHFVVDTPKNKPALFFSATKPVFMFWDEDELYVYKCEFYKRSITYLDPETDDRNWLQKHERLGK